MVVFVLAVQPGTYPNGISPCLKAINREGRGLLQAATTGLSAAAFGAGMVSGSILDRQPKPQIHSHSNAPELVLPVQRFASLKNVLSYVSLAWSSIDSTDASE